MIALAIAVPCPVFAGAAEDYAAGDAAYRSGDVRGAIANLRKAADAGHLRAQVLLGFILDGAELNEEAARYLAMAVAQGDAEGAHWLAGLYSSGEGVPRDLAKARELYEQSAAAGYKDSAFVIASAYIHGGLGLTDAERSSPAALSWIQRAAGLDHLPSIDRLAVAYRKGELGLPQDLTLAESAEARARKLRGIEEKRTPTRRRAPVPRPQGG